MVCAHLQKAKEVVNFEWRPTFFDNNSHRQAGWSKFPWNALACSSETQGYFLSSTTE